MDIILWICVCTAACMGVAVMLGDFFFVRHCEQKSPGSCQLFALYDDPAEVERVLYNCLTKATWAGCRHTILLVDMGMGQQARAVCRRLSAGLYNVVICREDELGQVLRRLHTQESLHL